MRLQSGAPQKPQPFTRASGGTAHALQRSSSTQAHPTSHGSKSLQPHSRQVGESRG